MNKTCIVNVATGIYVAGQNRLRESLQLTNYTGDMLFWTDELPPGSFEHDISPMGYKAVAVQYAADKGYKNILWLDANIIVIRNINTIFTKIKAQGYYTMTYSSQNFGEWCSDIALQEFGITRDESFSILELTSSVIGFNVENPYAKKFLDEWLSYALDGKTFRGIPTSYPLSRTNDNDDRQVSQHPRVKGHRHDQTTASFLAWKYKFKPSMFEVANYEYRNDEGESCYSKTIPLNTIMLHNRDTKSTVYLKSVDKFGNTNGFKRLKFLILAVALTIVRYFRYKKILKKYKYLKKLP